MTRFQTLRSLWRVAAAFALALLAGCGQPASHPVLRPSAHAAASTLSTADLARFKVNELGVIPILEYHEVGAGGRWGRTVSQFRADLLRLYTEGYRPVTIDEMLAGCPNLAAGASPVAITFDDARESQFRFAPDGGIDPNCAIGIMQDFARTHPDFPAHATFYVLPARAFGPPDQSARKLQQLLALGCQIGNHTVTHPHLSRLTDAAVESEFAGCVAQLSRLAPGVRVDSVALPYGIAPHNRALIESGSSASVSYANRSCLLVGAGPAPSPFSRRFNAMRLPRIQTVEGPYGITFWLDILKHHPNRRFVAGGDPAVVAAPESMRSFLNPAALDGRVAKFYGSITGG
ncbi:MAG: polysaccharide deacetylase family protein [Armatimonadetes bacterium]|nr:polysaccharide deacetylase family protein [Armatimonadota bacterium]MDE2207940.1 polysaccharide deacetylase family protein [Armatimonadota bacterium]